MRVSVFPCLPLIVVVVVIVSVMVVAAVSMLDVGDFCACRCRPRILYLTCYEKSPSWYLPREFFSVVHH
jgi:hypothetical protein